MKKVCVVGLGYIGLPTASLLATKGYDVLGVDTNEKIVSNLKNGEVLIHEPSLDVLVKSAVQSGKLKSSTGPQEADVFIIAVPTPFTDGFKPDITYVKSAVDSVIPFLRPGNLVILESTSPVGTTRKISEWIDEALKKTGRRPAGSEKIHVVHSPERVLPGRILKELIGNDRVIGGVDDSSGAVGAEFYREFVDAEIFVTDSRTAELSKLVENSFRDVNIAFANELSMICDRLDINVWELVALANRHPRVNILNPGPGVGGHCIAVDPWFVVDSAPEEARLIRLARDINSGKPDYVIRKVLHKSERFREPVIACLGLSYKADIDDLRESPPMYIVEKLSEKKAGRLLVVEPHISELPAQFDEGDNIEFTDFESAVEKADIIVVLTDHRVFRKYDVEKMKEKVVIDTRGLWGYGK